VKAVRLLLWPAGLAVGLAAESAYYGFREPTKWMPDLLTGWMLIGCGLAAWGARPHSRVGPLLCASGFLWFVGNFSQSELGALAWVAQHAFYLHRGPLVHAILTFPTGTTRSRVVRAVVAGGYVAAVCEPVWADERSAIVLGLILVAVAALLYVHSVARERRARLTTVWVAAAIGVVVAVGAAARWVWFPSDLANDVSLLAYQAVLVGAAIALAGGVTFGSWERTTVADMVVELGEERSDRLRDGLARALGDPSLEVGYWSAVAEEYVDSAGRPLPLPPAGSGRAITAIGTASEPIGVLIHHPSLLDDTGLVESIATATRLASVNARLQAEVRAQIIELDASRRRIVTAADEEHRRLEARLQDGAERRLESLAARLHSAGPVTTGEATTEPLAQVAQQLAVTLDELRTLARGLHPRLLTESGLGSALDALAARAATAVRVEVNQGRLPVALEAVVYFVCAEALANIDKHAAASSASVAVSHGAGVVRVEISDTGAGGADPAAGSGLRNLIDRVQALGGTLHITSPRSGGTRLVAELPLGDTGR
jgi:signal transduction histidine kinase